MRRWIAFIALTGIVLAVAGAACSDNKSGDTQPPPPPTATPVPPPPPTQQPQTNNCHPSYTGACLDPNASDYDCAGGSGNGPLYTGPVQVVGPDDFDLDRNGDGYGCE